MNPIMVGKAITTPQSGQVQLLPEFGNRHGRARQHPRPAWQQAAPTVGNQVGRQILRGVMGGIFGGKR